MTIDITMLTVVDWNASAQLFVVRFVIRTIASISCAHRTVCNGHLTFLAVFILGLMKTAVIEATRTALTVFHPRFKRTFNRAEILGAPG